MAFLSSLLLLQPLLAEEFVNITDAEGCREIEASAERLLCYDTVAAGGVFNEQKIEEVQKENFGKTGEKEPEVSADQVSVTVVRVSRSGTGIHYFYTEDGAVWKQSTAGRWGVSAPFEAEIKTGVMGSYFLAVKDGKSVRVKRVK